MKITLTTRQALRVIRALEFEQNSDFPISDPTNKALQVIIDKIKNQLETE